MTEVIEIGLSDNEPKNLTVSSNNEKGTIKLSGLPFIIWDFNKILNQ